MRVSSAYLGNRPARVLDHGAGTGLVGRLLKRSNPALELVALDPNADLLSAIDRGDYVAQIQGTAGDLSLDAGGFDLVASNLVLPFCSDAHADLVALRNATTIAGALVLTTLGPAAEVTPFHRYWSSVAHVIGDAWEPDRYPHHRFGDADVLANTISSAGWNVVAIRRVKAARRISAERAWTWLSSVLPVGFGESYRPLDAAEVLEVRSHFLGRWADQTVWRSAGWTALAHESTQK